MLFLMILLPKVGSSEVAVCRSFWFSNRPSQDCSSMGLRQLPPLMPNVLSLVLSNNSLVRLPSVPTNYRRLLVLQLDECAIENIQVQVQFLPDLSQLTSLRLLDVSHNRLTSVSPRLLPLNLEVLRLSGNRFEHLSPWPFLTKLKELDVSFNTLECDCSLWQFVNWAEGLALFDSSVLPCRRLGELRKSPLDGKTVCGPTVTSTSQTSSVVSLGEDHRMCCIIAATPSPELFWQLDERNISRGLSQRHLAESGRVEYCLEIRKVSMTDLGRYRCVAFLAGFNASREFSLERDKIPIVRNSAEGLMIYLQFTICIFIGVCCVVSCCVLRSGNTRKLRPQREYFATKIIEIPQSSCDYCDNDIEEDAAATDVNRILQDDDWHEAETIAVRRYLQWRQSQPNYEVGPPLDHEHLFRLSREISEVVSDHGNLKDSSKTMKAPLAAFDGDFHFIQFVHTAV
ncbi:unnamed protein product [Caenorhabditis auriculariae]|uniref:Ig-like domain-containing protein n=1 Tax=Caenorhabditis auriculariae TaxID=2777116 RepID=A0A8S1GME0_9PELO|nr:unnamed protein product [Caenorhabditis auriculariae]